MPAREAHIAQARRNAALIPVQDPDWTIVVAFYAALHLIEAYWAESGVHLQNHRARNDAIRTVSVFSAVQRRYLTLYEKSRTARYDCRPFVREQAEEAIRFLYEPFRAHLCALLEITL